MNVGINNRASTINQIFVGVNNIARLVYQSGGGTPAFQLPEFTGNNAISGDELSGRIEMYETGTLTMYPGTYDVFCVGGGGGGGRAGKNTKNRGAYGGAGGGGNGADGNGKVSGSNGTPNTGGGGGGNMSGGSGLIIVRWNNT